MHDTTELVINKKMHPNSTDSLTKTRRKIISRISIRDFSTNVFLV